MENQQLAYTEPDRDPPPVELHPTLRQALIRVNPEYFAWSLEEQERYRVSMPEQDEFHLKQALRKALFGIDTKPGEDLPYFSDEENLMFNRAWLPVSGVGEDYFVLNEYGTTALEFDSLYDYDEHCSLEQARKEENPEYIVQPYRGVLCGTWAQLFIKGVFHYALLNMAAGYVYCRLEEFGWEKAGTLLHRYVDDKDHGKREGSFTIFTRRIKQAYVDELRSRYLRYCEQRFDALLIEFDGQARTAIYVVDKSRPHDPQINFVFSDKTALQPVRFRHFLRDCHPLITDRAELDAVVSRERQALNDYLESSCKDLFANFVPKVVPFREKTKVILVDRVVDDLL